MTDTCSCISEDDVEAARQAVLDAVPPEASEEFEAGWVDAAIAMDRRLTDPDYFTTE